MEDMITLTIDDKEVKVKKFTTVLQAAKQIGIDIPTLCYLKEINAVGDCRMCIVEIEGRRGYVPSCIQMVEEGMVVHTNTPELMEARKMMLDLILSNHPQDCLTCIRSGNCELQKLAIQFNMTDIEYKGERTGILEMRKHIGGYVKGLENASILRNKINQIENLEELKKVINNI